MNNGIHVVFVSTVIFKKHVLTFEQSAILPAIPPIGTHVTFAREEGESTVEQILLGIKNFFNLGEYTILLDTVDLSSDYSNVREVKKHFEGKGWNLQGK